jgi:hypothetical protein
VAGVGDGKEAPKEDTLRETPVSKGPTPRPEVPDEWKPPPRRRETGAESALAKPDELDVPDGARVDFAFGNARVRTFQVKGPLAFLLALLVLGVVGVVFALVFVFAVGIGAALAAGAAVAAALGVGVAGVRRLTGGRVDRTDGKP